MGTNVLFLDLYGITAIMIDGLVWGASGCLLYRFFTGTRKNWVYGAIIVGAVYFLWDEIITNQLVMRLGVAFEDPSASTLMEGDPFSIDLFDLVISFGTVMFGYWLGQKVLNRVLQRNSIELPSTGPVAATERTPESEKV